MFDASAAAAAKGPRQERKASPVPRKVAIDALAVGDPPQGIGAYSLNLVQALASVPGGLEYLVFLPEKALRYFTPFAGAAIRLVPCRIPGGRQGRILHQHLMLPRLVRREGAALLHAVANLLPATYRGPAVLTVHDLDFQVHPEFSPAARRMLFRALTPSSLGRAGIILTDSAYTAHTIRQGYPGVPPGKIRTIYLGAPEISPVGEEEKTAVVRRYGLQEGYFLTVGSLELRKNIPLVLKAFEAWRASTGGPQTLVLAGQPGYGYGRIMELVAGSPAREAVRLTGYVSSADLSALYAGAKALLLLSEAEGFGLTVLEAQARGCPVIAARAGALPETCGRGAALVTPGDVAGVAAAMKLLAGDARAQEALSEEGRRNVRRFSWAEHARRVREAYRELM